MRSLGSLWRVILTPIGGVDTTLGMGGPCLSKRGSSTMLDELRDAVAAEAGQTMAEYAVVLGVITIAVVVTLGLLSTAIKNLLSNVISVL